MTTTHDISQIVNCLHTVLEHMSLGRILTALFTRLSRLLLGIEDGFAYINLTVPDSAQLVSIAMIMSVPLSIAHLDWLVVLRTGFGRPVAL